MAITLTTTYSGANWNTSTTPKTVSVTVATGDTLVIFAGTSDSAAFVSTPTGGGLTYTLQGSFTGTAGNNNIYMWTAPAPAGQTFTLSVARTGTTAVWGFTALRFAGVSSVGTAVVNHNASSAPSVALTTGTAHSVVVAGNVEFTSDATAATYLTATAGTATQAVHSNDASFGTWWFWYHADAGTAGAKTIGMSAPTPQAWSAVVVELVPTTGLTVGTTSAITAGSSVVGARTDAVDVSSPVAANTTVIAPVRTDTAAVSAAAVAAAGVTAAGRTDTTGLTAPTTAGASVVGVRVDTAAIGPTVTSSSTVTGLRVQTGSLSCITTVAATVTAVAVGPGVVTSATTAQVALAAPARTDTALTTAPVAANTTVTAPVRTDTASITAPVTAGATVAATAVGPGVVTPVTTAGATVTGFVSGLATLTVITTAGATVTATAVGPGVVAAATTGAGTVTGHRTDTATITQTVTVVALVTAPARTDIAGLTAPTTAGAVFAAGRTDLAAVAPMVITVAAEVDVSLYIAPVWPPRATAVVLTDSAVADTQTTDVAIAAGKVSIT